MSASERQDEEQMPRKTGTRQGRTPPAGDLHRGKDPAEDPPPEGRATQGTHTEHTQTLTYLGLYTILPSPYYVWCMAYKRGVGGGGVYCEISAQ